MKEETLGKGYEKEIGIKKSKTKEEDLRNTLCLSAGMGIPMSKAT